MMTCTIFCVTIHASYSWLCDNCGMPNFSTTFIDSYCGIDLTNSFDALSKVSSSQNHGDGELDISNLSKLGDPIYSSSPKTDKPKTRKPNKSNKAKSKQVTNLKIINMNCRSVKSKLPVTLKLFWQRKTQML